jgi:hypothetical protein
MLALALGPLPLFGNGYFGGRFDGNVPAAG